MIARSVFAVGLFLILVGLVAAPQLQADPPAAAPASFPAEQVEFFSRDVAPILVAHCFQCHGAEAKIQGGLRLTSRESILAGGDSGPAVSLDKPEESLLLAAIRYDSLEMPPKGKLPQVQIDILTRWATMGAPWSSEAVAAATRPHGAPQVDERARDFWSFKPVVRPATPTVTDAAWVRSPIDAFVLAGLEAKGLRPAPPADKGALLRRLHYTVIGLPPTPAELDAFLADESTDAYERRVDALLASRHFGEHWGRHWLDLVRYAETNSFERDGQKPNAWKYRDYVIRAFNDDKPYGQFIREQLAGDELSPLTRDGMIATGYMRLGLWDDEPADRELAYYDQLDDIVSTTGQAFLGLTIGCARCHDHKIDPFPQQDYYRFLSFFHGVNGYGNGGDALRMLEFADLANDSAAANVSSPAFGRVVKAIKPFGEELAKLEGQSAEHARQLDAVNKQLAEIEKQAAAKLVAGQKDDFAREENRLAILEKMVGAAITQPELERYRSLRQDRDKLLQNPPPGIEAVLAVIERGPVPRETFILARGNPASPGELATPGFPTVLLPADAVLPTIPPPADSALSSGRRRVLADWIADPANPLTSRVMVNRLWQFTFGRGLVRSSSNFGYMGQPPTHPELLDWLASEFAAGEMRVKPILRRLLTSNVFRMSTQVDPVAAGADPENDLLSHFDLRRLTAEEIRDSILSASGNLNLQKSSGPSVYPMIPPEVLAGQSVPGSGWGESSPDDRAARSVFIFIKRSLATPLLASFDAPDPDSPCPVRFTTTQPSQALGMLNSQFLAEQSRIFAEDLQRVAGNDDREQVRTALRRVMQRAPNEAEIERGLRFLARMRDEEKLPAEEALARFCLLALNLNEFAYLD